MVVMVEFLLFTNCVTVDLCTQNMIVNAYFHTSSAIYVDKLKYNYNYRQKVYGVDIT